MAIYEKSTHELKTEVLAKCSELVDGTSKYDAIVTDYLNNANLLVMAGGNEFVPELSKPWPWAVVKQPFILQLFPAIQTITVSLTGGLAAFTLSAIPTDPWGNNVSLVNWFLKVANRPEWFRVTAHVSGTTTGTIESLYTDQTGAGMACVIAKLEYDITPTDGVFRLGGPMRVDRAQDFKGDEESKIYFADKEAMLREFPMNLIRTGTPTQFCKVSESEGVVTVRFNKYIVDTTAITKVEVPYIKRPDILLDTPTPAFTAGLTIATPGVFTGSDMGGLAEADPFVLATTGALPTGLTPGTTYYVKNLVAATQSFSAAATAGGSAIATTGTQSGIITVTPGQAKTYPLIPAEFRDVLVYVASYWVCLDKNDDRAEKYLGLAQAKGKALIIGTQNEKTQASKDRFTLTPRLDQMARGKRYVTQESS